MSQLQTVKELRLGVHKNKPRFWTEGNTPKRAGFDIGVKYTVAREGNGLSVTVDPEGTRTVSHKLRNGKTIPVLDINSEKDLGPLQGHQVVRVVFGAGKVFISPVASEARRIRRLTRLKEHLLAGFMTTAGICSGGGVLSHAVHAGLKAAGIKPKLTAFNEIRADLCDYAREHNNALSKDTTVLNMPLQELAFDEAVKRRLEEVDFVELGLPCSGASVAGRAKRHLSIPEEHPDVGHLVVGGLALLAHFNPAVVLFENVPQYANTASATLIRQQLRDMGYETHERELYGPDFGAMEARKRWCLVGVTRGMDFDLDGLLPDPSIVRRISDLLEPSEAVADRWSLMSGLKAKQERDKAEGKGFRMQTYDGSETKINTITAGYMRRRSTDPFIINPEDPNLLRLLTAVEHARMAGLPEELMEMVNQMSETCAHEFIGQGISYPSFMQVARYIGKRARAWADSVMEIVAAPVAIGLAA